MNFALLLTGCERTFQQCFPSIREYILDHYNPDVYICVDSENDAFNNLYHPIAMHVVTPDEDRIAIGDSAQKYTNKAQEANVAANVSLYWKWKKCYELVGNKRYDVVFIARPDILIRDFAYSFPTPLRSGIYYMPSRDALGTKYTPEHEYYGGWGGQLAFGDQHVAEIASRMYDHMDEIYATYEKYPHQYGSWHTERNFKRWMHVMNHIDMELFDIDFQILR